MRLITESALLPNNYGTLTFDWSLETIQIFLKLDGLFKAEVNFPAKTIQFILTLDSWQKLIKNRSVGNIGVSCSYIIIIMKPQNVSNVIKNNV